MVKEKRSLDDIVYEKLKKAITLKKFPPSYKLVEKEIADTMKVSRTPVHTAIKLLERDGLLTIIPNKGAYVTKRTYDEIEDAFAIRVNLEKMYARLAATNITEQDIEELRKILEKESKAYSLNNRVEAYTVGAEFHMKIADISGNSILVKYINNIMVETNTYDVFYTLNDPKLEKEYYTPKQHYDILDALIRKDVAKSEKVMEYHILSTETQLNLVLYDGVDNLEITFSE